MRWSEAREIARQKQAEKILQKCLKRQGKSEFLYYKSVGPIERDALLNTGWEIVTETPQLWQGSNMGYSHYLMRIRNPKLTSSTGVDMI